MMATPPGPYPSYKISSYDRPSSSPVPRWIARLMFSCGIFSALAARIAVRSRGLPSGSPPPPLAAIVVSLIRRVKILPRLASSAPFLCLIVAHLEWPDITTSEGLKIAAHPRRDLASISQPKASRLPHRAAPLAKISKAHRLLAGGVYRAGELADAHVLGGRGVL